MLGTEYSKSKRGWIRDICVKFIRKFSVSLLGCCIIIFNVISAEAEVLNINGTKYGLDRSRLVHIALLDNLHIAVVLRGSMNDLMIIFSTESQRKVIRCRMFKYISSLCFSENYGYFGHQNGHLSCIPKLNLLNAEVNPDAYDLLVNGSDSVKSILLIKEYLVLAVQKYMYQYKVNELSNVLQKSQLAHGSQPIREMLLNKNKTQIIVSFENSPLVVTFDAVTLERLAECDSENIIKSCLPAVTRTDIRINCMCTFADVLWLGTGSGHIVIYQYVGNTFSRLHVFRPYELEMRTLCAVELKNETEDKVKYLVCSAGKKLNKNIFGEDSFVKLTQDPLCLEYVSESERKSLVHLTKAEESNIMLIWQGIDAKSMRYMRIIR